jgi:polyphosphate kinase 2 (PPK2 family)
VSSPTGAPNGGDASAGAHSAAASAAVADVGWGVRQERVVADPPPQPDYPRHRVAPGSRVRLAEVDPAQSEQYGTKRQVARPLNAQRKRIRDLQARLYGEHRRSLLIVLQAMDTGGKDGTIKHVFQGVNPQGCQVWSFKAPSAEESDHEFLWRYRQRIPPRVMIHTINETSTATAPWYVVPANNKWYRNLVIARTIADTLEAMNPHYPAAEAGLDNILIDD